MFLKPLRSSSTLRGCRKIGDWSLPLHDCGFNRRVYLHLSFKLTAQNQEECLRNVYSLYENIGYRCYLTDSEKFDNAKLQCEEDGGQLALVTSAEINVSFSDLLLMSCSHMNSTIIIAS